MVLWVYCLALGGNVSLILLNTVALWALSELQEDALNTKHAWNRLRIVDLVQQPLQLVGIILALLQNDKVSLAVHVIGEAVYIFKHHVLGGLRDKRPLPASHHDAEYFGGALVETGPQVQAALVCSERCLSRRDGVERAQREYMARFVLVLCAFAYVIFRLSVDAGEALVNIFHKFVQDLTTDHLDEMVQMFKNLGEKLPTAE